MVGMTEDLKEPQIQDLAEVLEGKYTHDQLTNVLRRFDAQHLDEGSKKIERITNWLRNGNESGEARPILAYMIEDNLFRQVERDDLEEALTGSRFVLSEGNDGLELLLKISATAERQVETHRAYVEENAPEEVLNKLEDAEYELTEGNYNDAVHDLREALEKMVTTGYHSALDELVKNGIISSGSGSNRNDKEMLYMAYGYSSTVGSHTSAGASSASQLQAETALVLVGEAIYFLLQKLDEADQDRVNLTEWAV